MDVIYKRVFMCVYLALIILFLSSCERQDHNIIPIVNNIKSVPTDKPVRKENSVVKAKPHNTLEYDHYLTLISEEDVIKSINNFYINSYRNNNMLSGKKLPEGEEVKYDVYYAGDGYILAEFINSEDSLWLDNTFLITKSGLVHVTNISKEKWDSLHEPTSLRYLYNGSFTVTLNYEDYPGKYDILYSLKQYITYRYFVFSTEKFPYDNAIFWESRKADKINILDFDDKSMTYNILVYTNDGYVYDTFIEYSVLDQHYKFYETANAAYKLDDIINYNESLNKDRQLTNFVVYYNNAMDHVLCTIDANDIRNLYMYHVGDDSITTEKELSISEKYKLIFMINGKMISVKDDLGLADTITKVAWIDHSRVGIICEASPSLNYFTVYNSEHNEFEKSVYGSGFVWKERDVNSLIYIESPFNFNEPEDKKYYIKRYSGEILYETNSPIMDLCYINGKIYFTICSDGNEWDIRTIDE
jgi:hypothetical protein